MPHVKETPSLRNSQRAQDIMRQAHSEERAGTRVSLHLHGAVRPGAADEPEQLALVRDISFHGAFFYSNFKPAIDCPVELSLSFPIGGKEVKVLCEGKVVRVEESASNAYGIAVKLHRCDFVPYPVA
jgi:PilZ domain